MSTPSALLIRRFVVRALQWETSNTFTLTLSPEVPERMFSFQPGQWVYLHVLNEDGSSWARAAFSIATAPEESADGLELAIEVKGEFTHRASKLVAGDVVGVQGPFGVFTLKPTDEAPHVFFASGIGIAPLKCMLRSLHLRGAEVPVTLFYSNKSFETAAFYAWCENLQRAWPNLRVVHTLTRVVPEFWTGERGRLDGAMLDRHVSDVARGTHYMCGAPSFMSAVENLLAERGVDVKRQLRKELFN